MAITSTSHFQGRSLLSTRDFTRDELSWLIGFSMHLKELKQHRIPHPYLTGRNIALLFEKTSTRTRAAFTVAAQDLGAHAEFLGKADIQLGKKESVRDTALVLGSMFDGLEFRGFQHAHVEELAKYAGVPVWNGLTDQEHPTQMIADFMTIVEEFGELSGRTLAYFGQGRNNVQNSLMLTSAILGMDYVNATPPELAPDPEILSLAQEFAKDSGASITVTHDPLEAARKADVVYTNVWAAMGEEDQFAERVRLMRPYQVNAELVSHIENPDYIVMHCLPAFHNADTEYARDIEQRFGISAMEITDDVFYGDHARHFKQAENRMHSIKAIMAATLGNLYVPHV
ncbi:ornithine carbamoyltransferase [Devriesea agamarum]|uniref:ornithine carbamoyltransferase n=1 Tax=Devriesea agamarum TaxID=472569 RepID=UPI00071C93A1|nr:ornithine carbamoyltransferase [Devriesea agamarum]